MKGGRWTVDGGVESGECEVSSVEGEGWRVEGGRWKVEGGVRMNCEP